MARKTTIDRTVQFWRLVDARDGSRVKEVDWDAILRGLHGTRRTFTIDGREHAGTVHALDVDMAWLEALGVLDVRGGKPRADENTTYGMVLAAGKDFVPNQENIGTGDQRPMELAGDQWEPVDNLFVWMLPFGNMFAVLAESTSSARAAKFATWLNHAVPSKKDPEFRWLARPVVDRSRAQLLKKAKGLRAAVYAGEFGENIADASGVRALFRGPEKEVGAIRLEVRASLVRGRSHVGDDEAILDWFTANFGDLEGTVDKAQVTIAGTHPTEVDLLQQRLVYKTAVALATGTTRSFLASGAFGATISAFIANRAALKRLRYSDD